MSLYRFQLRHVATGETRIVDDRAGGDDGTCPFKWLVGLLKPDGYMRGYFFLGQPSDPRAPRIRDEYALDWVERDGVRFIENDQAMPAARCAKCQYPPEGTYRAMRARSWLTEPRRD